MDFPANMNGWTIYGHPCFKDQYQDLITKVEALKAKHPDSFRKKADTKILSQLLKSIQVITENPLSPDYRQGNTIGDDYTDWSRAKFGNGRYRLFFRFSLKDKIIVLAWFNDNETLRTYGSKTDAYKMFCKMLKKGNPPHNWADLLKACQKKKDDE